ncbi:uncharacterized protein LOC113782193 [Coffea eugenioides]|uniref:uncharacterized protein LOC113782193 n=1 Tax=Coffea eugenioides TaxID=49369 RepID=UPI000F60EDED|nr:uncharacterized protein LOC113782193 [Coffea eugenioides]
MSVHPESSDRSATTSSADLANLRAQLSEVLNKFSELSREMTAQRRVIDQLVAGSGSGVQHDPLPVSQTEPQPLPLPYIQTSFAPHVVNPPDLNMSLESQELYYYFTAKPFTLDTAAQGKVEVGESSAPIDKNLLKRLNRFDEFIRKSQGKPIDDENLPVRLFPESLEGDALDWYSNLKPEEMRTWVDLSTAFVRQYEYNCEFAPTRITLEKIKRKPSEHHKTYAKRWRKLTAKVEPPMNEEEIVRTFIKTHDLPYFEKIFHMTGCSFVEIINKLEEYDEFARAGEIVNVSALKSQLEALQNQNNSSKKPQFKKKEGEAVFVWDQGLSSRPRYQQYPTYPPRYPYYPRPQPVYHTTINHPRPQSNYPNTFATPFYISPPNFQTRPRPTYNPISALPANQNYNYQQTNDTQNPTLYRTFTNLDRPIDQLYEQLKTAGKIGTIPPKVYPRGFPLGYNPQSFCAYHSGAPGYFTTNCWALKHKIQDMIEAEDIVLRRREEQGPSIKEPIQCIVDETEIIGVIGEPFILEEETSEVTKNVDPFILDLIPFECEFSELVILEFPEQTPVLNLQEVPRNYSEPILLIGGEKMPKKEVVAVIRSERIISEPAVSEPSKAKENAAPTRPAMIEEETFNFLRMLKKNEYKVIEQLDKMSAQISMLNLLLTSELHRETLLKVLTETQVSKNISVDKFTHVV